jgi:hypothetical protein
MLLIIPVVFGLVAKHVSLAHRFSTLVFWSIA